jgi:hypothetical protein
MSAWNCLFWKIQKFILISMYSTTVHLIDMLSRIHVFFIKSIIYMYIILHAKIYFTMRVYGKSLTENTKLPCIWLFGGR